IRLLHLLTVPFSAHVFPTSLSFYCLFFFSMLPPLPIYPLFPYTTLFRSLPRTYISSSDLPHGRVRSPIPGSGAFDQISRARVPSGRGRSHTPNTRAGRAPHSTSALSRMSRSMSPAIGLRVRLGTRPDSYAIPYGGSVTSTSAFAHQSATSKQSP